MGKHVWATPFHIQGRSASDVTNAQFYPRVRLPCGCTSTPPTATHPWLQRLPPLVGVPVQGMYQTCVARRRSAQT